MTHPHDTDDSTKTIAQLCAPLSAKVMPRSALLDNFGEEKHPGRALARQRNSAANQAVRRKKARQAKARGK